MLTQEAQVEEAAERLQVSKLLRAACSPQGLITNQELLITSKPRRLVRHRLWCLPLRL